MKKLSTTSYSQNDATVASLEIGELIEWFNGEGVAVCVKRTIDPFGRRLVHLLYNKRISKYSIDEYPISKFGTGFE